MLEMASATEDRETFYSPLPGNRAGSDEEDEATRARHEIDFDLRVLLKAEELANTVPLLRAMLQQIP